MFLGVHFSFDFSDQNQIFGIQPKNMFYLKKLGLAKRNKQTKPSHYRGVLLAYKLSHRNPWQKSCTEISKYFDLSSPLRFFARVSWLEMSHKITFTTQRLPTVLTVIVNLLTTRCYTVKSHMLRHIGGVAERSVAHTAHQGFEACREWTEDFLQFFKTK